MEFEFYEEKLEKVIVQVLGETECISAVRGSGFCPLYAVLIGASLLNRNIDGSTAAASSSSASITEKFFPHYHAHLDKYTDGYEYGYPAVETMRDVRRLILSFAHRMQLSTELEGEDKNYILHDGARGNISKDFLPYLLELLITELSASPKEIDIMQSADLGIRILAQLMSINIYLFNPAERTVDYIQGENTAEVGAEANENAEVVYLSVKNGHYEVLINRDNCPTRFFRHFFEQQWIDDVSSQPHRLAHLAKQKSQSATGEIIYTLTATTMAVDR